MMKNISCLGIVTVILFTLLACKPDDELVTYKNTAKEAIKTYAQERKNNYDEENWLLVSSVVEYGKLSVDNSEDKFQVEAAVTDTKALIANIGKIENKDLGSKIKSDFLQQLGYVFRFDRFYGLYDGAAVFFVENDDAVIKTVSIAGVEFSYH